ncbi:MAG: DUF2878 family protein [Candidatus Moranbacteria bacterium]|nr:DUF2878 family protein [Candidatus Moranbacteria bacterium]
MQKKVAEIFLNALPVILMLALIPLIKNDYILASTYIIVIMVSLWIRKEINDLTFLIFGFVIMTISEYFFLKTGVEKFNRVSLLGVMPLWLPFLWAYGFVAIKRASNILNK